MENMATSPFRSWVEISCPQIVDNFRAIRQTVGPAIAVVPVVKADAYHHGAIAVSRLLEREGVEWLAVSNVEEGVELRLAGIRARILVMADFLPVGRLAIQEHNLTPVIHDLSDIGELGKLGSKSGTPIRFHLKVDSGMCRLGTRATVAEIANAMRANPHVALEGLMTHFASVGDFTKEQTAEQVKYFMGIVEGLKTTGIMAPYIHLSSTGGIAYRNGNMWGNMVRPGHAIYGYVSPPRGAGPKSQINVKPVLTWKAAVLTVKEIPSGAKVGYGGMFRASETMRMAVLAVGYADGLPHRLSNRGRVIINGKFAPILGAVSMDLTTVDVTHCPDVTPGQAVTILGSEGDVKIDALDLARQAGTTSYSVLCGISSRVKRVYL